MNSGPGFLGHGWRVNSTIGRAVRLCLLNVGHAWPGVNDMENIGRPSAHTFYTFAENEELCPWPPYHVGQGFKPEDSCVTVSTVGGYGDFGVNQFTGRTVQELLDNIIKSFIPHRRIFALFNRGTHNPMAHPSKHVITLHPQEFPFFRAAKPRSIKSLSDFIT